MPKIPGYENQVVAQGVVNAQASPMDFGAGIGEGLQRIGAGLSEVTDKIFQQYEAQDITNIHTQMAAAREQWSKAFQDRMNATTPGDETFEPRLTEDMTQWFSDASDMAKTPAGKRLFQTLSSTMVSEFGQRAIAVQAQLAGTAARNQTTELIRSSAATVFNDAAQRDSIQQNVTSAFNDPKSIYAKIPKPHRDALLAEAKNAVDHATIEGMAQRGELLPYLAEATVAQFKPWQDLIQSYVAPGGKANISESIMQQAPTFTKAAAEKGLNPNILMAQADLKPGGNPVELANDMARLLDRYAGDYSKAAAAYQMGTEQLDSVLKVNGSNWLNALPETAKTYVNSVMEKSGSISSANGSEQAVVASAVTPGEPVRNASLPAFNGLTWEQQHQAITEAVRVQHLRLTMAEHARAEAERLQTKQQEAVLGGFVNRIYDPGNNGGALSVREVANDPTLTGHQKNWVVGVMFGYQRELKNAAETKSNPIMLNRLGADMVAADNDPTRAPSLADAQAALAAGSISLNDYMRLQGVYASLKDANGNSFVHQLSAHVQEARRTLLASPEFLMQPDLAEQAAARLQGDLQDKVAEYRKAGKNPRALLDPSSVDYFFKPGTLKSYTVGTRGALAEKAGAVLQADKAKLPKGRESVKPGELYLNERGDVMRRKN